MLLISYNNSISSLAPEPPCHFLVFTLLNPLVNIFSSPSRTLQNPSEENTRHLCLIFHITMTEDWSQAQADFYYGKTTIDELVGNIESVQRRADAAEKENAALKQQSEQQKKPVGGANDELVANLESCHHRVEAAEKENADLKKQLEQQKKPFRGSNDELVANLKSCHRRVDAAEKENTILKQQLEEKEKNVANLEKAQRRADSAEKENADFKQQSEQRQKENTDLKQQLEKKEKDSGGANDELVANFENAQRRADAAEKENADLEQQLENMILKHQQEEKEKEQLATAGSPLPLSATNLEIQNLSTLNIDLVKHLVESKKEIEDIERLGEEIADGQNGQIKELEEINERLKTELASLKRGMKSTNYHEQEESTSGKEVVLRKSRPEDRIEQGKDQEIAVLKHRVLNLESRAHDAEGEVAKQIEDINRRESEIEDLKEQLDLCHQRIGRPSDGGNLFPTLDSRYSGYRSPDPAGLFGTGNNREHNNTFKASSVFGGPSSSSSLFENASGGFGGAPHSDRPPTAPPSFGRPPPSSNSIFGTPAPGGQRYNSPFGNRSGSPSGGFGAAAPRPYDGGSGFGDSNNNTQRYPVYGQQHAAPGHGFGGGFGGTGPSRTGSPDLFDGGSGRVWTITDSTDQSLDQIKEMKERILDVEGNILEWSEKYSSLTILNEGLAHQGGEDILDLVKDFVVLKDGKLPFDPKDKAFDGQACTMLLQGFASHRLFKQILVNTESDKVKALETARFTAERVVGMAEWHFTQEKDRDDAIRDLTVIACDVAKIAFSAWSSQTKFDIYSLKRSIDELRSQIFSGSESLESHDLHTSELNKNRQALDKRSLLVVVSPIVGVVGKISFIVEGIVYVSKQLDAI